MPSQNFDTSSGLGGGAILRLTLSENSQNSTQSFDTYSLTLIKGAYASYDLSGTTWSASIDGTASSGSFTFDFRVTSSQLITSGSKTVTHNADGTKSISVSGSIGSTGTSTGGPATASGVFAQTTIPPSAPTGAVISRLSHTLTQPHEYLALADTEAEVLQAIQATAAEITLDTLPSELSTAAVRFTPGGSALDGFNEVLRTEQGAIYSEVTGTLLAPVQKLVVRERTRPTTVTASWDVETELDGAPEFVRDITNMVSTITVSGPDDNVTVSDVALQARVGSANTTETVLNTADGDLTLWGQDRLQRGANVQLRLASVTIDAMNTPTDRSADLLALKPGDRHRFTNLPTTQLGFSTWDGWLVGCQERHSLIAHTFTLYFQPVLPDVAIFDTNLFMADGDLALSADITNSATTMSVATTDATVFLDVTTFPYTIAVGDEEMSVTGCTTAAPQVVTVTRGVNGTTAVAHTTGALVEVAVPSLFAF